MSEWASMRVRVTKPDMSLIREIIWGRAQATIADRLVGVAEQLSEEGTLIMKQVILHAWTPTGIKRAEKGEGEAGRYETGKMWDMVQAKVTIDSKGGKREPIRVRMAIGWLGGRPGYAVFQEHGVSNRSYEPLHATDAAAIHVWTELERRGFRQVSSRRALGT